MNRLLQINSSILGEASHSTKLANRFVELWKAMDPNREVVIRELGDCSIPHLDAARFGAFITPPDQRTAEQQAVVEFSDMLIAELRQADLVVLAVPMYNFFLPSGLKAYFDHVSRVGETFRYTEAGPIGLLAGKKAVACLAQGDVCASTGDLIATYLRQFLTFLGFAEIDFVCAEGLNISDEIRAQGLAAAEDGVQKMSEKFTPLRSGEDPKPARKAANKR